MSGFGAGDLVVAIWGAEHEHPNEPGPHPVKGTVYTVAGHCPHPHDDGAGIYLEEIHATENEEFWDCFNPEGFRPVSRTASELFRKLVSPTPRVGKPETVSAGGNVRAHDETIACPNIPRDSADWRI